MIAVVLAVHATAEPAALAQVHVVGIDAAGALVHKRARLNDEVIVQVEDLRPPKTISIRNRTGFDVKVYEYSSGDVVMAVARKGTTLKNNNTMSVSNDGSNIKVFRPALLDQYLTMHRNARTNLEIVRSGSSAKINAARRQSLVIANTGGEELKIAVYNERDAVQAIPKYVAFVKPGVTASVSDELGERFRVSVFWPRALDQRGWSEVVKHGSKLTISSTGNWTSWRSVVPAQSGVSISELAVDSEINATGAQSGGPYSQSNAGQYYVYGLAQDGKLWWVRMGIEGRSAGTPAKFHWGKWETLGFDNQLHGGLSVVSVAHDVMDTDANNQELFTLDAGGQLIRKRLYHQDIPRSQQAPWEKHGGRFTGRPSAVAWGDRFTRQVTVYAIDPVDKTLRELNWQFAANKWNTSWTNLGGNLLDAPSAVASAHGTDTKPRIDVFARGADNQLWQRTWLDGVGWKAWQSLGGHITSSPSAVQDGKVPRSLLGGEYKPIIRVVARGAAGDYQMITWDGDKWGKWESLGGKFRSAPLAF